MGKVSFSLVFLSCLLSFSFITTINAQGSNDKDTEIKINESRYGYTPKSAIKKGESNIKSLMIGPLGIHIDFDEKLSLMKVREVEETGPANNKLKAGDYLIACGKKQFPGFDTYRLKKGNVIIPRCAPVIMLANEIDKAEGSKSGKLFLTIKRNGKLIKVAISLERIGTYGSYYPFKCKKSRTIATRACDHLVKAFRKGAWGDNGIGAGAAGYETGLCGLALLAQSDQKKYMPTVHELAKRLMALSPEKLTKGEYLCNTYVTVFLCEYYLLTKNEAVKKKLEQIYQRYLDGAQPYGGWGHRHREGIYGGGGYAISTGHVVMAIGMLSKIVKLDKVRTKATMTHLCAPFKGGSIGYCGSWKIIPGKDDVTPKNLERGGEGVSRTGTTVLGMSLLGYDPFNIKPAMVAYLSDPMTYIAYFLPHCCHVIGQFPCTIAVARENPIAFRAHLDAEKWWYTLGRRYDGELLLGPIYKGLELRNDFQKKYGLLAANACVALIHSVDQRQLYMFKAIRPFTKLDKMGIYKEWNNWLISRKGSEPQRPASVFRFEKPRKFPVSVSSPNKRVKEQVDFKGKDFVVIDAEVLSTDWRQLLYLKDIKTGNLYWTVIQRGDDNCSWYKDGKLIFDPGEKLSKRERKYKKENATKADKLANKENLAALEECLSTSKRVRVTLRAEACTNPNGGWLKAHKLEFFDK